MYAIFNHKGKQYKVSKNDFLKLPKISDLKKNTPKGEFVVIVAPNQQVEVEKPYISIIKNLILKNFSNKDIVDLIKPISTDSKKEIYKIVLSIRQGE